MKLLPTWSLIVITCGGFALGLLLTYTIGVVQGHFRPAFPYVSDTGAYPIENGFFVLVFAIICFLCIMIQYIRYKDAYIQLKGRFHRMFNFISLLIGITAIFFLMSVAAFQFDDSPLSSNFHNASAGLAIFIQLGYIVCQTIIGILLPPKRLWWKWVVFAVQLTMMITLAILTLYFFATTFHPARSFYKENRIDDQTISREIANDETLSDYWNFGLQVDYSRAAVEWIIFAAFVSFYLTLIPDFIRLRVNLVITRSLDDVMTKLPTVEMEISTDV